ANQRITKLVTDGPQLRDGRSNGTIDYLEFTGTVTGFSNTSMSDANQHWTPNWWASWTPPNWSKFYPFSVTAYRAPNDYTSAAINANDNTTLTFDSPWNNGLPTAGSTYWISLAYLQGLGHYTALAYYGNAFWAGWSDNSNWTLDNPDINVNNNYTLDAYLAKVTVTKWPGPGGNGPRGQGIRPDWSGETPPQRTASTTQIASVATP